MYGVVPLVAVTVSSYASPTVPPGSVGSDDDVGSTMTMV